MLYTSDESLNSTPETNIALPVNELRYKLKKRDTNGKVKAPLGLAESQLWGLGPSESVIPQTQV